MADRHHHRQSGGARIRAQPYAGGSGGGGQHAVATKSTSTAQFDGQPRTYTTAPTTTTPTQISTTTPTAPLTFAPSAPIRTNGSGKSTPLKGTGPSTNQNRTTGGRSGGGGLTKKKLSAVNQDEDGDEEFDPFKPHEIERDPRRLEQRQKQIDLGKNTPEYKAYILKVPIPSRVFERRYVDHPVTPNKTYVCSKRSWDGQVRKWRRLLHSYDSDVPLTNATTSVEMTDTSFPLISNTPVQLVTPITSNSYSSSSFTTSSIPTSHSTHHNSSSTVPASVATLPLQPTPSSFAFTQLQQPQPIPPQPTVLFTQSTNSVSTHNLSYNDSLASFDDDLDLLPPELQSTTPATSSNLAPNSTHLLDEELVDYDEELDEEMEMRNQALEAARQL